MNKKMLTGLIILTILATAIPLATAVGSAPVVSSPSGETYRRGDDVTITATSYAGDTTWTIQIQRSSTVVWIDKVASIGSLSYTFTIPSSWSRGTYTIYVDGNNAPSSASTTFYLSVPVLPPIVPPTPTTPTVATVQAMTTAQAANTISNLDNKTASKIMTGLTESKAINVIAKLNVSFVKQIFEEGVKAGNATNMANLANGIGVNQAADVLLEMNGTKGANLVQEMAKQNLNDAALRVEEAVKRSGNTEKLAKFGGTLQGVPAADLVSLFREIAGLPNTPSTVARLFEVMDITKVIDIVDTWMETESYEDLALVYGYLNETKLEEIFLSMSGEDRTTLYPYLDANTTAKLPEIGELTVSNLSINPNTVDEGDIVTISVTVSNDGLIELTEGVNLKIEGSTVESEMVTLLPDASSTLTWTVSEATAGTYSVEVNGLTGSFTVEAPPEPEPANIVYESIAVQPTSIEEGGAVTVTVTLENTGEETGTETVELYVNDAMTDSESVTVAGGATKTVAFTVTEDTAGTYTVEAGEKSTTFTVTAPEEPPSQFPWTYVIVAVVIIAAAAYIYMQQQKQ